MAEVSFPVRPLSGGIKAVLDIELAVAVGVVNGMRPGIACDKIQAFGSVLPQRDLQSVIDGIVVVCQLIDIAQSRELVEERPPSLLVRYTVISNSLVISVNIPG